MPQILHCSTDIRLVHIARPISGDAFSLNRKVDHACQPDGQQDQISQMPVTANTVITMHQMLRTTGRIGSIC